MQGVRKMIWESVDEHSVFYVVEGHQSHFVVHIDSNPGRSQADCQAGCGFWSEDVLGLIPQAEEPIAMGGACGDFAFSIHGVTCYSQVPISLFPYLHLEVGSEVQLTAWVQTLFTKLRNCIKLAKTLHRVPKEYIHYKYEVDRIESTNRRH